MLRPAADKGDGLGQPFVVNHMLPAFNAVSRDIAAELLQLFPGIIQRSIADEVV